MLPIEASVDPTRRSLPALTALPLSANEYAVRGITANQRPRGAACLFRVHSPEGAQPADSTRSWLTAVDRHDS